MKTPKAPIHGFRAGLALLSAALCAGGSPGQDPGGGPGDGIGPFVASWCVKCHGHSKTEGKLVLEGFQPDAARAEDARVLRRIRERLEAREMPPPGGRQPPAEEVDRALDAIAARLAAAPPPPAPDPGRPMLRRLSRVEYENTVRDLLGVEADLARDFPADDLGYGFDNIGDVLSVSPLLLEKYLDAAERIAEEAVVAEDPGKPPVRRLEAEEMRCSIDGDAQGGSRNLFTNGDVSARIVLPRDGDYVVRARAAAEQAGSEPARLEIRVDGERLERVDVANRPPEFEVFEARTRLAGGAREVAAAFVNDHYEPKNPDPERRDRNLLVDWVEIVGPVDPRAPPAGHRWILGAARPRAGVETRARDVAKALASRAWRRPAAPDEVARIAKLITAAVAQGASFERGVQVALQAVLVSPHFLFRVEIDPRGGGGGPVRPLDGFEVAARLSYFLWSSLPDEELARLAARDMLRDAVALRAEARRMLAGRGAVSLATNFAAQWLELRGLDELMPDPVLHPGFDPALRAAMRREAELLVETVVRERLPLRTLLDAGFTFVNEALARHYGLDGVRGPEMRRVEVRDGRRGGFLAMAAIHAVTANPTRTSPVKRGKWILDNVLDAPPPPPPPGAGALDERKEIVEAAPIRERLERHRRDPSCSSCHARMDALGFALENYDPIGRWRDRDGAFPVDATGTLPDGRSIAGPGDLRKLVAGDRAFVRCLLRKLFVFALGRPIVPADEPSLDDLLRSLPGEPTFEDAVLGIVSLDAFRFRRADR